MNRKMLTRRLFISTSLASLAPPALLADAAPLSVVTTTGMIADTVRRIGGNTVSVRGLMGAGVDPHSYRQTRNDIVAMTRADLVLWNGLYLEAQMEPFLQKLARRQPVYAVTDRIEASARAGAGGALMANPDYTDAFDPHIWMDPGQWQHVADRVAEILIGLRPGSKTTVTENLTTFVSELDQLTAYGKRAMAQIPHERRVLITAHDAFSYFGQAFGLDVMGVQGISTESEAGLHRIRELVDLLVERNVEAIFVESSVSDRNMRALIEGAEARGHEVRLGGQLFSDAMGPAGTYEGTYVGMIDHNITTIARALGADVPQGGLFDRLSAGS